MSDIDLKNRVVKLSGTYSESPVNLKNARITEGLSMLTETKIEFVSSNEELDMQNMLGSEMTLSIEDYEKEQRYFTGHCISCEYLGLYQGLSHFVAEVRPWLWFLTRQTDSRIFQEMTVIEIIMDVLERRGFSSNVINKVSATYKTRTYCVQYEETDFDFISRLMEEEGIYYYFVNEAKKLKMVLADDISAHKPVPNFPEIDFIHKENSYRREHDHIFDWAESTAVTTGKVTLSDYDFEKPTADMKKVKAIPKGDHSHRNYEEYHYPGHHRPEMDGAARARVRMEALAVKHKTSRGAANVRTMGVGRTFKLLDHMRKTNNIEYLVIRAVHHLQIDADYETRQTANPLFDSALPVDDENKDTYRVVFDVIPKNEPYRAEQKTPWPAMTSLQTAVVTGPAGEEIYTDEYGRIKVQFFWDRLGETDDKTTCWVRCVMPWTGKSWGMFSIPRIGQEVVIQFEDGDPDRPICTGMLYNKDTMPPYAMPDNMTQTGIVTRSTKDGGAETFNELVFEDKMDGEFVRLQSERDYFEKIKNNVEITVGMEHMDPGSYTQTIYGDKTEEIVDGNHKFDITTGNQTLYTKGDHEETIDGNSETTVEGNTALIVSSGDLLEQVKSGSIDIKADAGEITIQAAKKITLKVGGSKITLDMKGVTVEGTMVKVEGKATADVKAASTNVSGDAMLVLKGGMTMIN